MQGHNYYKRFMIRSDAIKANGTAPLYLDCHINGERCRIHLTISILPQYWKKERQRVEIPDDPEYTGKVNALISKWDRKAELIFLEAMEHEQPLTARIFKDKFQGEARAGRLVPFIDKMIEQEKDTKAKGTIVNYKKLRNKLLEWDRDIRFHEVNLELIEEWNRYLHSFDYETNTIGDYHKQLRKFLGMARKKKLITENPYTDFKITWARTKRVFLSEKEVQALIDLYADNYFGEAKQRILRGFLFMCNTGLRYGDLKELRYSEIHGDVISFRAGKTRRTKMGVDIPLNAHAKRLITDARQDPAFNNELYIFDIPSNQKMNVALKVIMDAAGITKHVTSHVGRHTFATLFLLAGGQVQVLQKLLDHANIKTPMVYMHIINRQKLEGLQQMGDLFSFPNTNKKLLEKIGE